MVTTGAPIDAATAERFGLVNQLVPSDKVLETALDMARAIAANAPISVRESLAIARATDRSDADLRRVSRERMAYVMSTDDAKEGPKAFVERRKPQWSGR
jgi:enoyl-CoA hydratase/carnithine racemase